MKRTAISLISLLVLFTGCSTFDSVIPRVDEVRIEVSGTVEEFVRMCEEMHFDDDPVLGDIAFNDCISFRIMTPKEFEGKVIEIKNLSIAEIHEAWTVPGNVLNFTIQKKYLRSPYGNRILIPYVNGAIEDLVVGHIKSIDSVETEMPIESASRHEYTTKT